MEPHTAASPRRPASHSPMEEGQASLPRAAAGLHVVRADDEDVVGPTGRTRPSDWSSAAPRGSDIAVLALARRYMDRDAEEAATTPVGRRG